MLQVQQFLQGLKQNNHKGVEKELILLSHFLCKTYGWDYYTLIEQPIPFIFALLEGVKIENREKDKAFKSKR